MGGVYVTYVADVDKEQYVPLFLQQLEAELIRMTRPAAITSPPSITPETFLTMIQSSDLFSFFGSPGLSSAPA